VVAIGAADGLHGAAQTQLAEASGNAKVAVIEANEDLHESLQEKPPLQFGSVCAPSLTILVDDAVRYQP
jgi:hypothetical protein